MSFLCDFILLMRWVDPRLKFYNLVDTYALNSLSVNKQLELWTPVLSFPNARQAEEQRWKLGFGYFLENSTIKANIKYQCKSWQQYEGKEIKGCPKNWQHVIQGVKVVMLGRQNERNSSYVRLGHTSIFGLCFMSVCLMKSNFNIFFFDCIFILPKSSFSISC